MGEQFKIRYPKYFKNFKCIGGSCTDSCCIGWDVDIDKNTLEQYENLKDSEIKSYLLNNIIKNNNCTDEEIDYSKVKLKEKKRCPFLDEDNFCIIHSNLGEEYLSNVCTSFPRTVNNIDGTYEISIDVACPSAAELILLNKDGIEFEESTLELKKHIVSSTLNTSEELSFLPTQYFNEIRNISFKIIKDRSKDIEERLCILGRFINNLEDKLEEEFNHDKIIRFIESYDLEGEYLNKNKMNYLLQMDFFKKMIDLMDYEKTIDSKKFKELTKEVYENFKLDNFKEALDNRELFINLFEEKGEKFIKENEYVIENYLINYMYLNLFPFSEIESIFDSYIMLLVRYAYIKFYIVGLKGKIDNRKEFVEFIQLFSKVLGHHREYFSRVLNYLKDNELDNIDFLENILLEIGF